MLRILTSWLGRERHPFVRSPRPLDPSVPLGTLVVDTGCVKRDACAVGEAAPLRFTKVSGKPVVLAHGVVVEGSADFGGIQPNYVIDRSHPAVARLLERCRALRDQPLAFFDKAQAVSDIIRDVLVQKAYDGSRYLALLERARDRGEAISLGDYVPCRCGVCREHAMLTHLGLLEAGIDSAYLYARATQGPHVEDHGVALAKHDGVTWVVDSYNANFDGGRLEDFLKKGGSRPTDPRSPHARPALYGVALAINPYPSYWLPSLEGARATGILPSRSPDPRPPAPSR